MFNNKFVCKIYMLVLIFVSLFFMYMLLYSSNIQNVMNCNVRRFLRDNIYFRQVMIFFTIYFFTFVLNWYTPYNIYPNTFLNNVSGLPKYLTFSAIIYVIFVLTSCINLHFSLILFILIFILLNIYLYRDENMDENEKKIDITTFLDFDKGFDIVNILQIFILLTIIVGFIYNLIVTKKISGKNFDLVKFLFTRGLCD